MTARVPCFSLALAFFTFMQLDVTATVRMTGPEAAFRNVRVAMTVFAEENEGRIAASWEDLEPYLHMGAIEKWLGKPPKDAIALLADVRPEPKIDGKRVVAILLIPSEGGTYWAAIEDAEKFIVPAVFADKEVRNSGIDLSMVIANSELPESQQSPSSAPEEEIGDTILSGGETASQNTASGASASGKANVDSKSSNFSTWTIVVIVVAVVGILLLLIRVILRGRAS